MKEEFIKLETAELAVSKGFKEHCECRWVYQRKHTLYDLRRGEDITFEETPPRITNYNGYDKYEINLAPAPSQGFLQKWLREEHGLHPHICWIEGNDWHVDVYKWKEENGLMSSPNAYKHYKTYEEALEVGLNLMLDLI